METHQNQSRCVDDSKQVVKKQQLKPKFNSQEEEASALERVQFL